MGFAFLDLVRVARVGGEQGWMSAAEGVLRPPRVGDVGTVVDVFGAGAEVVVEDVDATGHTVWLASFAPGDLELVEPAPARRGS